MEWGRSTPPPGPCLLEKYNFFLQNVRIADPGLFFLYCKFLGYTYSESYWEQVQMFLKI